MFGGDSLDAIEKDVRGDRPVIGLQRHAQLLGQRGGRASGARQQHELNLTQERRS